MAVTAMPVAAFFLSIHNHLLPRQDVSGMVNGVVSEETTEKLVQVQLDNSVNIVQNFFVMDKCDFTKHPKVEKTVKELDSTENLGTECALWHSVDAPSVLIVSGVITIFKVKHPAIAYINRYDLEDGGPLNFAIDIVGGPAGDITPGLNDSIQLALAESGTGVLKLGYSGTRHGSSYPKPDLDIAVSEVSHYARLLRKSQPECKIILLGESLGAHVAAKTVASSEAGLINGLALVVPLVFSPGEAIENFKKIINDSGKPVHYLPVNVRSKSDAGRSPGFETSVSSLRLFDKFFPRSSRNTGLIDYLKEIKDIPIIISYGEYDNTVGNQDLISLENNMKNVTLFKMSGAGHSLSSYWAVIIADKISEKMTVR